MGNYIQGQVGAIEGSMLGVTGTLTNDSAAVGVLHATMPDGSTLEIRAKSEFTEVGLTEGFEARSIAKDGTQFTTYIGHADAGSTSNAEIPQEEGVDIRGDDPIEVIQDAIIIAGFLKGGAVIAGANAAANAAVTAASSFMDSIAVIFAGAQGV